MLESWAPVSTAMKKKVNFFGRPPSVDSGAPLGKKVVIQHKCDIMLEEQVWVADLISLCFIRRITIYYMYPSNCIINTIRKPKAFLVNSLYESM